MIRERSNSDAANKESNSGNASAPLAFTPTAVMKKMAAERRDSDPRVIQLQLPSGGGGGQQVIPELRISQGDAQSQEQDQQQQV